jgi:NAD(P)-dependent dehydrogenase (short-subunit alcohol dehydrogenase family)
MPENVAVKRLEGQVALITGGGDGMGRSVALRFASEGASVALVGRTQEKLDTVAETIRAAGGRAETFAADLAVSGRPAAAVEVTQERLGGLDILINAAGAPGATPILDMTEEAWDWVFDQNLRTMFFTMQAAARVMQAGSGGRIVNFSSIGAKGFSRSVDAAYVGAKAAIIAISRLAAMRLAPTITVNTVVPGVTRTEPYLRNVRAMAAREGLELDDQLRKMEEFIPLGRSNEPEDVAALVTFLVSDDARNITGQSINVDGGLIFD